MAVKRVFICGIDQETNCFNPCPTTLKAYEVFSGEDLLHKDGRSGVTIKGALKIFQENNIQPIAGTYMRAGSGGPVEHAIVADLMKKIAKDIQQAGKIDGVLFVLHGATVSDTSEDVCGDIIAYTRGLVGEDVPMSASFDMHANITDKTLENVNYVSGFQTYPHLDMYEVGCRAATVLVKHLQGKPSRVAKTSAPFIAPAHGYTSFSGGYKKLFERAEGYKNKGEIIDYAIFQAQPWLDVKHMSSTVIVTAEDEETAKKYATLLMEENFALKEELQGTPLFSIEYVIQKALENTTNKPVILVDSADSPNAGATSDCATVIEKMLPYRKQLRAAVAVTDPKAVEMAFSKGVGAVCDFELGGTLAPKISKPVFVKNAKIKCLSDGTFYLYGPQERGQKRNIGKCAVLEVDKISILVSTTGQNEGDLNFYRSFGIEVEFCQLVSVKACTSFRAGYEKISAEIFNASTPGAAGPVLQDLPFEKRPKPMYPFEEITVDSIKKAKCYR